MPVYDVKATDKRTKKPTTFQVVHSGDRASVKALIEGQPGSLGGTHPGFTVDSVTVQGEEAAAVAEEAK